MLSFISVLFCNAYIIVTVRVTVRVEVWWFGVAATSWSLSAQLFYIDVNVIFCLSQMDI